MGMASWWIVCHILICIITTRPLLYTNELRTQRSGLMKVRSNCQREQCRSNVKWDFVTASPVSHLKCFQKHICVPEKWETGPPSWKDLSRNQAPSKSLYVYPTLILHGPVAGAWGVPLHRDTSSQDLVCLYLQGVFTPIVHLLWSRSVDELADSLPFSLWFDLVSLRQNVKWTKTNQQKPCGSCHSADWSEITSVK